MQGAVPSPFYQVQVRRSGRNLTEYVTSVRYEDCVDMDDILKLSLRRAYVNLADDADLVPGTELVFFFGFLGAKTSKRRVAYITAVEVDFGGTVDISVTATDMGLAMKLDSRNQVWKNQTISQIISAIAQRYSLTPQVTPTSKVYPSMEQGNKNDFEFMKYLCTLEPGGYRFYVKDKTLVFSQRDLKQGSGRTFTYGGAQGNILRFRPRQNENTKPPGARKTTAVGVDPATGLPSKTTVTTANDQQTRLGKNKYVYDANSNVKKSVGARSGPGLGSPPDTGQGEGLGQVLYQPGGTQAATDSAAEKVKADQGLGEVTATLSVPADPEMEADTIITIQGVGQRYGGNWYVTKVTHELSSGGYQMTLDLKKNATNAVTEAPVPAESQNQSIGKTQATGTPTKKVYRYNANAGAVR